MQQNANCALRSFRDARYLVDRVLLQITEHYRFTLRVGQLGDALPYEVALLTDDDLVRRRRNRILDVWNDLQPHRIGTMVTAPRRHCIPGDAVEPRPVVTLAPPFVGLD